MARAKSRLSLPDKRQQQPTDFGRNLFVYAIEISSPEKKGKVIHAHRQNVSASTWLSGLGTGIPPPPARLSPGASST